MTLAALNPAIMTAEEVSEHDAAIEKIHADAFGPGRFARTAFRIREGGPHERALSRVALLNGDVIGSVRMTRIVVGKSRALLLGPLAVLPSYKNQGIGRSLMQESLDLAREAGHQLVILVGDEPYYGPFGFKAVPAGSVVFPAPVDERRILACALVTGADDAVHGAVRHADLSLSSFSPPHG